MNQPSITMYVRPHCSDVDRARVLLRQRALDWREIDIDTDADALRQVREWNDGRAPTPTLWIGQTMLVEPGAAEIDEALARETV